MAVFKPNEVGAKVTVNVAELPGVIVAGKLIPPTVNKVASAPVIVMLLTIKLSEEQIMLFTLLYSGETDLGKTWGCQPWKG